MNISIHDLNAAWQACLMFLISIAIIILPDFSFAGPIIGGPIAIPVPAPGTSGGGNPFPNDNSIGYTLCTVVGWFTSNTGKGLATIAITIIGIGALLGKVSWGMVIIVGVGIAILFGAGPLLTALEGGTIETGCNTGPVMAL